MPLVCFMRILLLSILLVISICFPVSAGRTVTDVWNRDIVIPDEVDSIIAIGSMGPRMAAYLDVIDMLVGAEDSDKAAVSARYDYSPAYHEELASLPSVGRGGGSGENNAYAEEIIMLRPDVIIAGFDAAACEELERQTGIPVVSIRYRTQGFIDEGFYRSMRIFASVVGAEERCEEVLSYIDECKADLRTRTDGVPAEDKLRAYTGAVTFNGRHGFAFTYVNFPPFDAINALNVADTLLEEQVGEAVSQAREAGTAYIGNDGFEVDPEMVMEWDPDIIFIDLEGLKLINEHYETTPEYYEQLQAVKNGRVYSQISYRSSASNLETALADTYYAGTVIYPEQFEDVDPAAKADEIFNKLLGTDFYGTLKENGYEFKEVVIGQR